MTVAECSGLITFLNAISGVSSSQALEFIEPNLKFSYCAESKTLTISFDQEAKPNWLASGDISFNLDRRLFDRCAKELEYALGTVTARKDGRAI